MFSGEGGWPRVPGAAVPHARERRLPGPAARPGQNPVAYLVFDLLQLDGGPLLDREYRGPSRALLDELGLAGPNWQTPPYLPRRGLRRRAGRLARARHGGRGGQATGVQVPARGQDRQLAQDQEPAGPGGRRGRRRAGQGQPDRPGRVAADRGERRLRADRPPGTSAPGSAPRRCACWGSGWSRCAARTRRSNGPVPPEHARTAVWVEPRLVIDVAFDRWTRAGRMRAPVYKRLRDDKNPRGRGP